MEIPKELVEKYDSKNSLLVVSSFPKRKEIYSEGVCGLASFTKNTIKSLKKIHPEKNIIVLAISAGKKEVYEENGVLIIRCFSRNKPFSYLSLLKNANLFKKTRVVLLEFEFSSFGDTLTTSLLPFLVLTLFLSGKKINIVAHQIILDLRELCGHIGISSKNPFIYFLNFALSFYYKFLFLFAKSVIVLEEELKNSLSKLIKKEKITVIPHGVDQIETDLTKTDARKILRVNTDDFVILYFGYLTWYKGVDFLIKSLSDVKRINSKPIKVIVAGGPSFTQKNKKHYKKFLKTIRDLKKKSPQIIITGFVKEKNIPVYFRACDLTVFPYRTFMSASGALATALSFKAPFILSKSLNGVLTTEVNDCLKKSGLSPKDIFFQLTQKDLVLKIKSVIESDQLEKLTQLTGFLAQKRSFGKIAYSYNDLLFKKDYRKELSAKLNPLINATE